MMLETLAPTLLLRRYFCLVCAALLWVQTSGASSGYRSQDIESDALVPLKTHSIGTPFVDGDLQNKFWDFGGDTIIDTGRHVRLTQDKHSQSGWLWSRSVSSFVPIISNRLCRS